MEKFWSNSHLFVSILLTALVLTGSAAIVHYAAETEALEDVEEDTSRLQLNAERWLSLQQRIDLAIRGDRSRRDRFASVRQSRQQASIYEHNIEELLDRHPQEDVRAMFAGLVQLVATQEKAIDEIAVHLDAGQHRKADELLAQLDESRYLRRAETVSEGLGGRLDEWRRATESRVNSNVDRKSTRLNSSH